MVTSSPSLQDYEEGKFCAKIPLSSWSNFQSVVPQFHEINKGAVTLPVIRPVNYTHQPVQAMNESTQTYCCDPDKPPCLLWLHLGVEDLIKVAILKLTTPPSWLFAATNPHVVFVLILPQEHTPPGEVKKLGPADHRCHCGLQHPAPPSKPSAICDPPFLGAKSCRPGRSGITPVLSSNSGKFRQIMYTSSFLNTYTTK